MTRLAISFLSKIAEMSAVKILFEANTLKKIDTHIQLIATSIFLLICASSKLYSISNSLRKSLAIKVDIGGFFHGPAREKEIDKKIEAAIKFQKKIRSLQARKPFLTYDCFDAYKAEVEKTKSPEVENIPRAYGGKTPVFLPVDREEIILKRSGRKEGIERFHKMQEVRSVLDSQESSHLIIPKALLCQQFLVEERLPINTDSFYNMDLYLNNLELFNEPVRELVRLFSKISLTDLVCSQNIPLGHIEGVEDFIRYDNLPLYLVENKVKKEGRIGLIDLEHLKKNPTSQDLLTIARIFPYHLELIKEEAKKLQIDLTIVNVDDIDQAAEKGKKYLKVGYSDHLDWLRKQGFSLETTRKPFKIDRLDALIEVTKNELIKLNKGENDYCKKREYIREPLKDFFEEPIEEKALAIAKLLCPGIVEEIEKAINWEKNEKLNEILASNVTDSELVSLRSPVVCRRDIYKKTYKKLCWDPPLSINVRENSIEIAEQLLYVILDELVKGGEIFSFDPAYYSGSHNFCWIRY